jgi:Flp pilus assembly protein TadB
LGVLAFAILGAVAAPHIYIPEWLLLPILIGICIALLVFRYFWLAQGSKHPNQRQAEMRKRVLDGINRKHD